MLNSRRSYNYTEKEQSKDGRMAVVLGTVSVVVLLGLIVCSITTKGQLGQIYGLVGVVDCFVAFYGFMTAIFGFREENTNKSLCVTGLLLNIVPLAILIWLFVSGIC